MFEIQGTPIAKFAEKMQGLGKEAFLSKHRIPALVIELAPHEVLSRVYDTQSAPKQGTLLSTGGDPRSAPETPDQHILFLEKSDRNKFGDMCTVGRSSNNDVVIPHLTISKLHAVFREIQSGYMLKDVGSTNGTFLDGERLVSNLDCPLISKQAVRFGSIPTYFFTPDDLFDYIGICKRMGMF